MAKRFAVAEPRWYTTTAILFEATALLPARVEEIGKTHPTGAISYLHSKFEAPSLTPFESE